MPREIIITDPRHEPRPHSWLDRVALRVIKDERDLPFIRLITAMTVTLVPGVALLYWPGVLAPWDALSPVFAIGYWALLFLAFVDRYILMLHCISHRACFRPRFRWLNRWVVWGLGPLCGETPETYYVHHVGMHHVEGNMPDDLSSTMRFRRDRLSHFLAYFLRFFLAIHYDLGRYHYRRKRWALLRRMIIGEGSYMLAVAGLAAFVNWQATVIVFVVPLVMTRFLMMAGNWSQHAFIDPDDPGLQEQHRLHQHPLQPALLQRRLPRRPSRQAQPPLDRDARRLPRPARALRGRGRGRVRGRRLLPDLGAPDAPPLRRARAPLRRARRARARPRRDRRAAARAHPPDRRLIDRRRPSCDTRGMTARLTLPIVLVLALGALDVPGAGCRCGKSNQELQMEAELRRLEEAKAGAARLEEEKAEAAAEARAELERVAAEAKAYAGEEAETSAETRGAIAGEEPSAAP